MLLFIVRGLGASQVCPSGGMVDTPASGAGGRKAVEVQVLSRAPNMNTSQ